MIVVKLNLPEFEYDIHSLVKAFFPEENVSVSAEEKEPKETVDYEMTIHYTSDKLSICWNHGTIVETAIDFTNRTETKNTLKQMLYQLLSKETRQQLPWGTLTGIRPTKIPMKFLEEGISEDEIKDYMKHTYLASQEKIDLSIEIAKRELGLLKQIDYRNGYSLYIGIPFCPTTCLYCSFTSYPLSAWRKRVDDYLDALEKEIDFVSEELKNQTVNSVYIGGGTPTTLEAGQLERLIGKIKGSFDLSHCLEFTVEAGRPDSITREKLQVLRNQGISRISINPQTMKQETLDIIGRHHTVEQTVESFQMARELGFENINMDLIMGLPQESLEDVKNTLEKMKQLAPDNLTVHSLALKRAARLNMFKEDYKDYQMVNTTEHMDMAAHYAREIGLEPYYLYRQKSMAGNLENVGYAAPGKAGIYNILIMEEKQTIIALGAGATSKFVTYPKEKPYEPSIEVSHEFSTEKSVEASKENSNKFSTETSQTLIERVENVKDVGNYLERIDEMIERKREKIQGWKNSIK